MSIIRKIKKLFSIQDILDKTLLFVLDEKGKRENRFYTVHKRPKTTPEIKTPIVSFSTTPKVAIVLQGLLLLKDNFTLETVRLYRKYFPDALIILSTHPGEDEATLESAKDLGCIIVKTEKLANRGFHNVNAQLSTSYEGIKVAKDLGAEYVIKTRMDQRMYNENALQLFFEFDKAYPPSPTGKQTRRLILPNLGTPRYRIYGVGDMLMFGHINDMMAYWGAPHDDRKDVTLSQEATVLETAKLRVNEVYISAKYLEHIGHPLVWTVEDTWKVYGEYFCIFDHALLDLFWYKYDSNTEFRFHYYTFNHSYEVMQYAEWLSCYNKHYIKESLPEHIVHIRDGASLENPNTPKFSD